ETFPVMCMGGYGVVSVAGHLVAGQIKTMMHLILDSEIERAAKEHRRLLPLFKALFWVTSPVPVKFAINRIGLDVGPTRLPLVPAEEAFIAKFNEILDHYQLDLASEI
ncbi:MAG: 4-hydroxy-tetrahydrodipicolinate synthase, partial [Candidatus Latescibacteria bacterium]|nr:4-hydroxy-tetrahydrodipicolinate synthase [Candidatus Latescibacterota bacterium]